MAWNLLGIIAIVCAVLCAVGFYKFVYFLSIGYGFAVAGGGITILILALVTPTSTPLWILLIEAVLFVAYGVRLSGFLLVRELKSLSYRKTFQEVSGDGKRMPIFVLIAIWICVTALYTAQVSPMLYRYSNGATDWIVPVVGFAVSVFGLLLESLADHQKSEQKKVQPDMVATKGLYRLVRCPNYLGEILFWTGVFVSGITAYQTAGQWLLAIVAYVCIVFIMFNGAQRLEKRQMARYGDNAEYRAYADKTPILLPWIPLYHLNRK